MKVKYVLRTDIVTDDRNQKYTTYGISAINNFKNVLKTFPNIFFSKDKAEEFVNLCNEEKLELIHLKDVVEDVLY